MSEQYYIFILFNLCLTR